MWFGYDYGFWIAVTFAVIFKIMTSNSKSFFRACATVVAALFCAVFLTDPTMELLGIDADRHRNLTAGLLALTGEGLLRALIAVTSSEERLGLLINTILGRGGRK